MGTASEKGLAYRASHWVRGICTDCKSPLNEYPYGQCKLCREAKLIKYQQRRWDARVEKEYSWELKGFINLYGVIDILEISKQTALRRIKKGYITPAFIADQGFWFKRKDIETYHRETKNS